MIRCLALCATLSCAPVSAEIIFGVDVPGQRIGVSALDSPNPSAAFGGTRASAPDFRYSDLWWLQNGDTQVTYLPSTYLGDPIRANGYILVNEEHTSIAFRQEGAATSGILTWTVGDSDWTHLEGTTGDYDAKRISENGLWIITDKKDGFPGPHNLFYDGEHKHLDLSGTIGDNPIKSADETSVQGDFWSYSLAGGYQTPEPSALALCLVGIAFLRRR